ncbi:MAG: hypothetical protein UV34_C0029G0021 [Parcubacteria group bacterium GW2011_GWB1_42_6]|nr:MAG: hypothetical protein UV34_C0029G0021 [Parcubacteria group bacterium GW2011_GWB1_42_6]
MNEVELIYENSHPICWLTWCQLENGLVELCSVSLTEKHALYAKEAIQYEIDNLDDIGIKDISFQNGEYKISTFDKMIYVKDFNDIRYDFIEGKIRNLTSNEDLIIEESLNGAYEILKKIKYKG